MDLRPVYRITVHLIAAVAMLANGLTLTELALPGFIWLWPAGFGGIVSVLYIVWMINLYNFMDGMDGFAGGMTVIGFTTLGMLGGMAGDTAYATLALIVAASAGGFLLFNYPPARIFMGDAGSSTLGFLAAFFSLWGASLEIFPFWIAVLVFSPFIIDATVTLFRRLLKGERVWQAHKSHFYQRLVQLGWGHKRTVNAEYLVMILCATLALFLNQQPDSTVQWTGLAGMATVYAATMLWITRMERQKGAT
jgi:UDP-N-acetylmuramyl pentapeptide phosphotransferase/UDP-N-acetylglucosamine-1-phosphate transferase